MALRYYTNGAPLVQLSITVNASAVTLTVASTSGYPAVPFTLALERGTVNEEVCLCTGITSTTFTVTRGWDGTTGKSHTAPAPIEHTSTAVDYADANAHIYDPTRDDHTQYTKKTLWALKGSMVVSTGLNAPANFPIGSDNTALIADSTQASGVKWALVPNAAISNGAVSFSKLDTTTQQAIIQKLTTGSLPGSPVNLQVVGTTDNNRLVAYIASGWLPVTHGVGRVYLSNAGPSGGQDGDVWMQYT